ncbi:MAG: hypothetical protein HXX19_18460 [Rhodoferax sp.]|nr:hypothetical protein [Rhodoferax sp.]
MAKAPQKSKDQLADELQYKQLQDIAAFRQGMRTVDPAHLGGVVAKLAHETPELATALVVVYAVGVADAMEASRAPDHLRGWAADVLNGYASQHRDLCHSRIQKEAAGWM